ncbi:hypothetical protein SDJN03_15005, partial [Cucurbita argyrosperma subsp. sororia]
MATRQFPRFFLRFNPIHTDTTNPFLLPSSSSSSSFSSSSSSSSSSLRTSTEAVMAHQFDRSGSPRFCCILKRRLLDRTALDNRSLANRSSGWLKGTWRIAFLLVSPEQRIMEAAAFW